MVGTCHQHLVSIQQSENEIITALASKYCKGINIKDVYIQETTREIAEKIILRYEWLGTLPAASVYYGAFYEGVCVGVSCFLLGSCGNGVSNSAKMFGLQQNECAYLLRGACAHFAPKNTASKLIAEACKRIGEHYKIVFAYSDISAGEIGTIYQSLNWYCLGKSKGKDFKIILPNHGEYRSSYITTFRKKNGLGSHAEAKAALIGLGATFERIEKKIRYFNVINQPKHVKRKILEKVNHLIIKYPKRWTE